MSEQNIEQLAHDYANAWINSDLEGILGFHAEDSLFRMNVAGWPDAQGISAIRERFSTILTIMKEHTYELRRLYVVDNVLIWELGITGTFIKPLQLGDKQYPPTGQRYDSSLVDFITWEDGLIKSKETWLDVMGWLDTLQSG